MYLLSSNKHKIREYQALGIDAIEGSDMPEVLGNIDEVIIYKILKVSSNVLVEDTMLIVDGEVIVDTKFRMKEIAMSNGASWVTSLGYKDEKFVYVFRGIIEGRIIPALENFPVSFEPYFIPTGANTTLYQLRLDGKKDMFSARVIAVQNFRSKKPVIRRAIDEIPEWKGEYQNANKFV